MVQVRRSAIIRLQFQGVINNINEAGDYDQKGEFEINSMKKKGFSISRKNESKADMPDKVPGPGAYNSMQPSKNGPSYSIGHSAKLLNANYNTLTPSPLEVEISINLSTTLTTN